MNQPDGRGLQDLTRDECLRLIASLSVGRIAVNGPNGAPHVVPVNYVLDIDVVEFRTDAGVKLAAISEGLVTFQVDLIDPFHRTGWSVMLHGVARATEQSEQGEGSTWAGGSKLHLVRIEPITITGRRILPEDIPGDDRGYL